MTTATLTPSLVRTEDHRYFVDGLELPGVTRILHDVGLSNFNRPWFTDAVKERGTLVHAAIALDNAGELDDDALDPVLAPYVDGWRAYRRDAEADVEFYERPVCDLSTGYAGTLDAIVLEGGNRARTLIDIKPALYPSVGPQTAGYLRAVRQSGLYPTPVLFNRVALILPGDGSYRREPLNQATDEMVFLAAVRIFHFRSQHDLR